MKHRALAIAVGLSTLVVSAAPPYFAQEQVQERVDADINAKIRKEAQDNSKILRTMHYLTDVYGPRFTGSPNLKAAGEWAIKEMGSWGFSNGRLEPWTLPGQDGRTRSPSAQHSRRSRTSSSSKCWRGRRAPTAP